MIEQQSTQPHKPSIYSALMKKNMLIVRDNLSKYVLIYLSPFLLLLLLLWLQNWANKNFLWQNLNPPIQNIPQIPKCYGKDCITLAYAVDGQYHPYIKHTIQHIKNSNNLPDSTIQKWNLTLSEIMNKLTLNPNKTQAVILFCTTGTIKIGNISIPCYGQQFHLNTYTIIFNLTLFHRVPFFSNLKGSYPKDLTTIKLKKDIDQGIITYYNKNSTINLTLTDFPSKNSRFITGFSIFAQYGSFFIMIPYLILMVMQGSHQLKQKQCRLRIGLNIVGVSHLQFYMVELFTYFIHIVIVSGCFCAGGYILDFKFWSNAVLWYDFVVLVVNGFILGLVVFCITAAVDGKNVGMSILYGFVLYSIVMQWLFSGGYIFELLYMNTAKTVVKILKYVFNLYPSFHFTKIFADISRTADNHYDTLSNRYVEGRTFVFEDLFFQRSQSFQKPFPRSYTLPSQMQSLFYMGLGAIGYIFVLFLFDRFIESNRGYSETLCPKLRTRKQSTYDELDEEIQARQMVRITNLQKIYKNKVHALRGVSVELNKGDIVSLLGENGAGKSTLINILIGVLQHSKGEVLVQNMNVQKQRNQIRKIIGVCPQFDILWQELTAEQHIEMFSKIKGWPHNASQIKKCLESVNLWEYRTGKVKTFSGGMRRRLSLAISLIGNPKLVVLDEPTTGMDAKIRLQTWKIILKLRDQHRTLLITTHNMEEAECVSDRILIMSKGRIVAKGTASELKEQFGQGYIMEGQSTYTGEQMSFKFKQQELQTGMKQIQKHKLINWSLQQTTLEQVFLNASSKY